MSVESPTDCTMQSVLISVVILMFEIIPPTTVVKVNFIAIYKEGCSKTGTLPEQKLDIFTSSSITCTILMLGK